MRIFVAGATGVIGRRLVPLLVANRHDVAAMTRSESKLEELELMGVTPILCDVFDRDKVVRVVTDYEPDIVIHQLTELPDNRMQIPEYSSANNRIRREGTKNLVDAAQACDARVIAQSVAWILPGDGGAAVEFLERTVLAASGVVLRYGQFYGPGTYFESEPPPRPRVHVNDAASGTLGSLSAPSSILDIVEL